MNPQDTKVLEDILKKDAENLTEYEVNFINARESYLNNRQRAEFASVLRGDNANPKVPSVQASPTTFSDPLTKAPANPVEGEPQKPADAGNNYSNTEGLDEEDV